MWKLTNPIFYFGTFPYLKIAVVIPLVIILVIHSSFMMLIIILHLLKFPFYN